MLNRGIQLIVGLRNPGEKYAKTRHNVGAWFIERLSTDFPITLSTEKKFNAQVGKTTIAEKTIFVVLPNTFMNVSGMSIAPLVAYYRIPLHQVLVMHDDLDLEPGCVRLKQSGGHGGHNGLRDIINKFSSNQFMRLRIGIGHPGNSRDVSNYVLTKPPYDDQQLIEQGIERSIQVLPLLLEGEIEKAMTQLHTATATT